MGRGSRWWLSGGCLGVSLALLITMVTPAYAFDAPRRLRGAGYAVGDTAFDVTGVDQSGNQVSLYQFYGEFVLLDFTAQWCAPSQMEARNGSLTQIIETVAVRGVHAQLVQVLLENASSAPATLVDGQHWASTFHLDYPVLTIPDPGWSGVFDQLMSYGATSPVDPAFPTHVLLGPDMKIVAVSFGADDDAAIADVVLASVQSTPAYQVFDLIDVVQDYALPEPTAQALEKPLKRAVRALRETDDESMPDDFADACKRIDRFRKEVKKSSRTLTANQATELDDRAAAIETALACSSRR
jgi:peroxiredoxin